MSFRLFVYYCAVCGAWAGFLGWILATILSTPILVHEGPKSRMEPSKLEDLTEDGKENNSEEWKAVRTTGVRGMALGLMVALGLSLLDAAWVFGIRRYVPIVLRVGVAILVGALGGLIGGMLGQLLYWKIHPVFFVVGWTMMGTLIGASIGAFEILASLIKNQNVRGSSRKLVKCLIGGTMGGLLGGILYLLLTKFLFHSKNPKLLWSPSGFGFVALGTCIGLLVGLAQILLKDAWVKVESGFRAGREMILAKEATSIGRGEACDIGLFGDAGVEKLHACIMMRGNSYYLEDVNTPGGSYVNDVKVIGSTPLRSGDLIRVGRSVLRFLEKPKKQ